MVTPGLTYGLQVKIVAASVDEQWRALLPNRCPGKGWIYKRTTPYDELNQADLTPLFYTFTLKSIRTGQAGIHVPNLPSPRSITVLYIQERT
jgi:hypothetical protein